MASSYWKNFKSAMHAKFQSIIENNTLEYRNVLLSQTVLIIHLVFKTEKNK